MTAPRRSSRSSRPGRALGAVGRALSALALPLLLAAGLSARAVAAPSEIIETSRFEFLNLPPGWFLVLVLVPGLVLGCRWLYRREVLTGGARWLPAALRFSVLALVCLFLFDPVQSRQRVRVERPVAAILVDDSASLRERDLAELADDLGLPENATRSDVVRAALAEPLARLDARYETLLFGFGDSLRALGGLDDLSASDGHTRLGDALAGVSSETRGRDLAQVVVVTDGRINAGREVQAALGALDARGVPVSTVGVGDPEIPRDVRISRVTAPEVALAGDTVNLEVSVGARGYGGDPNAVIVREAGSGRELARVDIVLAEGANPADATEQSVRVGFVPDREGDLDLLVSLDAMPAERDTNNNVERRMLRVEPGRMRVLYVDGYPRYEYRFLVSMLLRSPNIELQCLLLSADEDFLQESTDLIPSLMRFPDGGPNVDVADHLRETYHVIIFGDVLPQGLGPQWEEYLEAIKSFVESGGGFLMQAGSLYSPREYENTPIAQILPVILGDFATERQAIFDEGAAFRPLLTRPRAPHEVVSLDPDPERNRFLWEEQGGLEPLTWYYPVAKPRTTAEVQLVHPQSRNVHGPHALLATMYYPQGRTAFLGTDETWRWRLRFLESYREPFWRGLIRFLALNKLRRSDYRFDLTTDQSGYDIGERMAVTARVLDSSFEPLATDAVDAQVVTPDGNRQTLTLEREEDGVFAGTLMAADPGPYRMWLEDPEADTGEAKSPRIVTVSVPSAEQDDPVLDESLLRAVATRTGGRYVHLADVDRLLDGLDDLPTERPLDEPEREEMWAGFPQLLLLILLLAGEWILRKRQNLV